MNQNNELVIISTEKAVVCMTFPEDTFQLLQNDTHKS